MPRPQQIFSNLKALLSRHCGYETELFQDDYAFGRGQKVDLAAFSHRPFDARSVCVAAFLSRAADTRAEVMASRVLGAPVVFVQHQDRVDVWRPGPQGVTQIKSELTHQSLSDFVQQHQSELSPRALYDAKTRGRLPDTERQLELFVDPGLLRYAEGELGRRLTETVVQAVNALTDVFPASITVAQQDWVFKATFRLLAAKILKDKRVPRFLSLKLSQVEDALKRVEKHYGSRDPVSIRGRAKLQAIEAAAKIFQELGDLRNLTTEALADVYEQALITAEARRLHGTHKTPSYLVDYVVWQLANWIEEIPADQFRAFEPACGHAPFLVSVMRLLRSMDLTPPQGSLSDFFRNRFIGIESDPFALEIARLSLTVADEPNPDGWHGLDLGDMYAGSRLESLAAQTTLLLGNPPYEVNKATRMLERTLPNLPVGAVFGVVVPATLLFSGKRPQRTIREWLVEHCQLAEVSLFPDRIFTFSDHECAVLLGRRLASASITPSIRTRLRRVREPDRSAFRLDYKFTTSRVCPQGQFANEPATRLWIAEFDDELWSWLRHLPKLGSLATVGKGLEYKGRDQLNGAKTIEPQRFRSSVEGFASSEGDWHLHEHPTIRYFNVDPTVIRRPGGGTDRVPQVLVNYAPRRGVWRLRPFIDPVGRIFTSRFISIRPSDASFTLEALWAICCSPLANLFVFTHALKREVPVGILRELPVFTPHRSAIQRITRLAKQYRERAKRGVKALYDEHGYTESELQTLLKRLDSEVLRLYDLPAHAERALLDNFSGEQRLGVPVPFTSYYPRGFTNKIPLYAYMSDSFQRALRGEPVDLTAQQESRYDQLVQKHEADELTPIEAEELHVLQAEVDGRDFAVNCPSDAWVRELGEGRQSSNTMLRSLNDRLTGLTLRAEQMR